jgi:hypothetical protein
VSEAGQIWKSRACGGTLEIMHHPKELADRLSFVVIALKRDENALAFLNRVFGFSQKSEFKFFLCFAYSSVR